MRRSFREALKSNHPLIGTLLTTPSPEAAEVLARSGFDWLFLDTEHGSFEASAILPVLRAIASANPACYAVVRVPDIAPVWFKKTLDAGPDGIIVPLVNTPEQARQAVAYTKYPPVGERSVGLARAQGYGADFKTYVESANDAVALIVQIEHIRAVENLDAILEVAGIDAILIGQYDLSGSLGIPGKIDDPRVQEAVKHVRETCLARRMPMGTFVMDPDAGKRALADGCTYIAVGTDMGFLASAARSTVQKVK